MNDFGIYEYVVTKQSGKGHGLLRAFLILLTCLGVLGLLSLGLYFKMFVLFLAIAIGAAFLAFVMLRRYSSVDFEYSIADGTMTFAEIYGKRARRVTLEFDLKRCTVIAPADDPKIEELGAVDSYYALSSPQAENVYCAAFEGERGKKMAVYFEATDRALKIIRGCNPAATVLRRAV